MIKIIIDIFMYLFEFLLFYYYSDTIFIEKKSKKVRLFWIFAVNAILLLVYQLNITYLNVILMYVCDILLLYLLYNISFKTAVFHSSIFLAVMFASEIIVSTAGAYIFNDFNALESDINAYVFVVVISKILYFGIMMAVLRFFAQKERNDYMNKFFWILFVMPLASILMLLSFRYITYQITLPRNMYILWIISCFVLLLANILVFIIYEHSIKNTKELYDLKSIRHQEEQDKKYFEVIEQSNKDMRIFAHDIKNHLVQMDSLKNMDEVHAYVKKISPGIERFNCTGISKNKMLDLVISKYISLCESKNIKLVVNIKATNLSYIDDVDLSTLMNNLLDNAVESAEKSKEKYIKINIFTKNNQYDGLIIKNSCDVPPNSEDGILKTTKANKKIHGLGTASIRKIIRKYKAVYGWKYDEENNEFITNIAFDIR